MKPNPILTLPAYYRPSVAERLRRASSDGPDGCRLWRGQVDRKGYGKIRLVFGGARRLTGAHRAAWLVERGDIPAGLVVDHLCRTPACINVGHMELVTNAVNTERGDHSGKKGRCGRRQEDLPGCTRHGLADGYFDSRGKWQCRPCRRVRVQRHKAKRASLSA